MTIFDEENLKRALREAADDFAVSDGATERILDAARDSDDTEGPSRIRTFVQHTGRMRSSLMAAAACAAVVALALPLFNAETPPKAASALDFHGIASPRVGANKNLSGALLPASESSVILGT